MDYEERELLKQMSWNVLNRPDLPFDDRRRAAVLVMRAHYERSASSPDAPTPHPDFPTYVASWLHANGNLLEPSNADVLRALRRTYGRPIVAGLSPGKTYWGT